MKHNKVHLIYFSPTGTTRKTIDAIAEGLNPEQVNRYDLTFPFENGEQLIADGVAIIGIPVYAGRVPKDCLERMVGYKAKDIPTILVALYGNREFEDALVELRDVSIAQGFKVIAAGAFIGEHSYSTPERPIAADRPNVDDLRLAVEFGQQVAKKIEHNDFSVPEIDGNVPYKDRVKFGGVAPKTDAETCTLCGKCAEVCPVRVVTVLNSVTTQAEHCIMCSACVKACPVSARPFNHPMIEERREMLIKNCSAPKSPQTFL